MGIDGNITDNIIRSLMYSRKSGRQSMEPWETPAWTGYSCEYFPSRNDGLFCFISIFKFGSFKNSFAMITSLSELYFRFRRFILLVQTKKWFLWTMVAAQAAENHGDEWGLTWYLQWNEGYIHQFQTELAAAEAPSLKASSYGTSLKWLWRPSQSEQEKS